MIRKYLPIVSLSFLGAMAGMMVFYHFFNPVKKIYVEQEMRAMQTAEREVLFSDRFNESLISAVPTDFVTAANSSREAVVNIRSYKTIKDENYKNTYGTASGSGVIISHDGYIVTNYHVIEKGDDIEVELDNNKEYPAEVIGSDESTDLALLKIEAENLPYLMFGNSDSLAVGEWVMAIGNPFKLQSTVTAGIVSAKARNINILENYGVESFIQTDAAVNQGNSGGALVNTSGKLVGINAAIMTQSGNYEGFSFAIPSNLTRKVVKDLMEFGAVQRGWLGVEIRDVNSRKAEELDLSEVKGVFLDVIKKGGGADIAGLLSGDVMLAVNGVETNNTPEFMEQIARYRPGDKVYIKYIRDGQTSIEEVILRNQLNSTDYIAIRKDKILQDLGVEVRDLDTNEKKRLGEGVYIVSIENGSTIHDTNMEPGYIITSLNDLAVKDVDDLLEYLKKSRGPVVVKGFYENFPGEYPYTFTLQ
jgi:Do/DeqQ family serine protease